MSVPFFWISVGFAAGIALSRLWNLPASALLAAFLFGLPFLWILRGRRLFLPVLTGLFVLLGFLNTQGSRVKAQDGVRDFISPKLQTLEGRVANPVELQTRGKKVILSFVLSARGGEIQIFIFQPGTVPEFGDRVRVRGALERPRPAMNPGEFDYARYLAQRNIYFILKGIGKKSVRILSRDRYSAARMIFNLRLRIARRIERLFADEESALFQALILGMRKKIDSQLREDFIKTGTSHLLAISGMNISLVAGSFYLFLIFAGVRQRFAAFFALLTVIAYVFLAGLGYPVERAGWMASVAFAALMFERERHALNTFFLAFFILLAADPKSLASVSFQLSFISVFCLILFFQQTRGRLAWTENLWQSFAVMAGTFPIVIYYFNLFSLAGVLANLGAISLFDLAVLFAFPAICFGTVPGAGPCLVQFSGWWLRAGLGWIRLCAGIPGGYFYLPSPSVWQLGAYYGLIAVIAAFKIGKKTVPRWAAAFLTAAWLAATASFFVIREPREFRLTLLSAGKNELAHAEFPSGRHWLVNAGRSFPSDQAEWIVNPYLRSRGIQKLSGVLVTDHYKKHTGGLGAVFRNFRVAEFYEPVSGKEIPSKAKKYPRRGVRLVEGMRIPLRIPGAELSVAGIVKGQTILFLKYRDWNFLWLSAVNDEVLEYLESHKELLKKIDVLTLPASGFFDARHLELLFNWMDPEVASAPHFDPRLADFLKNRDISFLDRERYGALTFGMKEEGRGTRPALVADSFLRGRVGEWPR